MAAGRGQGGQFPSSAVPEERRQRRPPAPRQYRELADAAWASLASEAAATRNVQRAAAPELFCPGAKPTGRAAVGQVFARMLPQSVALLPARNAASPWRSHQMGGRF